ncbi:MAG: hypothetical protein DDT18_00517 [Actinobacteria bacterium]|nr:hypothetical protein [Actinomycetota bacterium]
MPYILRSIEISIKANSASLAGEKSLGFTITRSKITTMRASFRSILGIDKENWSSFGLSLILNKLSELIKTPVVKYSSLFSSEICGLSNVGQVLHGNGKSRGQESTICLEIW